MMNKILIVEDEFSISNFMKTVLEGDGYTVEVATCAAQARAALEKMEFSAMLLDLGLPDADGLELLRAAALWPAGHRGLRPHRGKRKGGRSG